MYIYNINAMLQNASVGPPHLSHVIPHQRSNVNLADITSLHKHARRASAQFKVAGAHLLQIHGLFHDVD